MAEVRSSVRSSFLEDVEHTIRRSHDYLLSIQYPEGYWWGEMESNATMEAEYLLLTYFLGVVDEARWRKLTNYILSQQRDDSSWGQYFGAPGDVSTSVECYFALKLGGVPADRAEMVKARDFILSRGGVPRSRVFTKIWLSLFGQWEWRGTPIMPPELMLLPNWSPLSIYEFSSWARATIVPMLIILTERPVRPVPRWACIDELYPAPREQTDYCLPAPEGLLGWSRVFHVADRLLRMYQRMPVKPWRKRAIRKAVQWIESHQEADGSWGGIQPPWVYSLIALKHLGYSMEHPVMRKGMQGFEEFAVEEGDTWRVQACLSPVWDTGLVQIGLLDSGMRPDHPAIQRATRWLVKEQVLTGGDWQVKNKRTPPGGWAFEFHNDIYPDIDDVAEVVMALNGARLDGLDDEARAEAIGRGVHWVLSMQSKDGGWGAFDKDNTRSLLTRIPFSDFGEALDPPSADVTAHVVEMLGKLGYTKQSPPVQRAYEYLRREQEAEGPWFGRWGVNYIYGTGAVLPALEAIGEDMHAPWVRRAVEWLLDHQNGDGGWGEGCGSYVDPSLMGRGPSTPSQTAWALMALLSAGEALNPATEKGIRYLVETQREDGSWDEPYFTGTGFPGYGAGKRLKRFPEPGERGYQGLEMSAGFMINYHMYRNCWPPMALGRYLRLEGRPYLGAWRPDGRSSPGPERRLGLLPSGKDVNHGRPSCARGEHGNSG